ncbi:hypothetical protein IFR05_002199 [Cadophora sp. M221]|nr:hypothetical protein IFR05_002199 [Cadophora sp. M221]
MANTEQHELVASALSKVAPLLPAYTVIEDVYFSKRDASLKSEFECAIVDLYTQILTFQIQIVKFYQKHGPERLVQSILQPIDWEGWNAKIQGADGKCQRMMRTFDAQDSDKKHQETMQSLDRIDGAVEKLLDHKERDTDSNILQWLCQLDPIDEHEFFLEETGTLGGFSARGLLRQMAWSNDDGTPIRAVKDAFDGKSHGGTRHEYLGFNRCNRLLGEVVSGLKRMTIIIDALDESSDWAAILQALETLITEHKSAVDFRLCLVSRRHVKVKDFFPRCHIFDVDLADRAKDMEYYVRSYVQNRKPRLLRDSRPDLEEDVIRSLCENSHGMFRWAQLQMAILFHPKTPYRTSEDVKNFIAVTDRSGYHGELISEYNMMFNLNAAHKKEREVAAKCYKFILSTRWPCSFRALSQAVALNLDGELDPDANESNIKDFTANILVENRDGVIQFAHYSARAYLLNPQRDEQYTAERCNMESANICLISLRFPLWPPDKVEGKYTRIERIWDAEDLVLYAVIFWGKHVELAQRGGDFDASIGRLLDEFLLDDRDGSYFQSWLQFVSGDLSRYFVYLEGKEGGDEWQACREGSPLITACVWGLDDCVQKLLQSHPNPRMVYRRNLKGRTALSVACEFNRLECLLPVISKLECLQMESPSFRDLKLFLNEALLVAGVKGHAQCMEALVERGAEISTSDETYGRTPLHWACWLDDKHGELYWPQSTLDKSVGMKRAAGLVRTHQTTKMQEEAVQFLLSRGADPNANANGGETPLHCTAWRGCTRLAGLLIAKNARADTKALSLAARQGHIEVMKLLLENGADAKRSLALHVAAGENLVDVAELLLDAGCEIDKISGGYTPLLAAVKEGYVEMVQFLIQRGASKGATFQGKNALQLARASIPRMWRPSFRNPFLKPRLERMTHFLEEHPYFRDLEIKEREKKTQSCQKR